MLHWCVFFFMEMLIILFKLVDLMSVSHPLLPYFAYLSL